MVSADMSVRNKGEVLLLVRMYSERAVMRALPQGGAPIFVREVRLVSAFSYGDNADSVLTVAHSAAEGLRARGYSVSTVLIYGGAEPMSLAVELQLDLCLRCEDLLATVSRELYGEGTVLFISPSGSMMFMSSDGRAVTYSRGIPDGLLEAVDVQMRYFRPERLVLAGDTSGTDMKRMARICAENGVALCRMTEEEASECSGRVLRALCKRALRKRTRDGTDGAE